MKERPILFNGEMVRAILDGRKTHTRRLFKFRETNEPPSRPDLFNPKHVTQPPPLGTIGDRLWVRETWMQDHSSDQRALYKASWGNTPEGQRWTPSIHMPRWASRITLEITGVRVERVQEITEEDAMMEGCEEASLEHTEDCDGADCALAGGPNDCCGYLVSAKLRFKSLWKSIYGNWDANPWVWVYEFRRIKP